MKNNVYFIMALISVADISKHGALTGISFIIPAISAAAVLVLEVIKDIRSSIKINGGKKNA